MKEETNDLILNEKIFYTSLVNLLVFISWGISLFLNILWLYYLTFIVSLTNFALLVFFFYQARAQRQYLVNYKRKKLLLLRMMFVALAFAVLCFVSIRMY
jgi:hypothetical protein